MKNRLERLWRVLRFGASSFLSFLLDYGLFCLMSAAGFGIAAANISARVCSSVFNFTLNRRLVFRDSSSIKKSAAGYFALAAVILLLNTLILKGLAQLGLPRSVAKLITEAALFVLSYVVQKRKVFSGG